MPNDSGEVDADLSKARFRGLGGFLPTSTYDNHE